ncbi:cytochrome P450 [Umezawaea endophytica]|uniref:Cytochrome P450 n=1 Tax=Umezawaea endophytica TaxID=1654476 RepID=A0A9X3A0N9_9PSEU|nr:cytochrome P450 [Umezawaea endophytica]MCS7478754.1 cytochrome P450 [Umezawaea endophytica]
MTAVTSSPRLGGGHLVSGHLAQLRDDAGSLLRRLPEAGDMVRIRVGWRTVYVVNSPELAHQVLVGDARSYVKGAQFEIAARYFGHGLATAPGGAAHLVQRRMLQPAFHRARLARYSVVMRDVVQAKASEWRPGDRVRVYEQMYDMAIEILGRTLFATGLGDHVIDEFRQCLPTLIKDVQHRITSLIPIPGAVPTSRNNRISSATKRLKAATTSVIAAYRASGTDQRDILSSLLAARDEQTQHRMTDKQIHDEIVTLIVGGTETTAATLSWAFHLLAANPHVEAELHAELDALVPSNVVRHEDLPQLPVLTSVIRETLRLHPTLLVITRKAAIGTRLAGFTIPSGAQVWINMHALHHDSTTYPEPDRFIPSRWDRNSAQSSRDATYLPFGAGNRKCIGDEFALIEAAIILGTLASTWKLRHSTQHAIRTTAGTTAIPMNLPMEICQR